MQGLCTTLLKPWGGTRVCDGTLPRELHDQGIMRGGCGLPLTGIMCLEDPLHLSLRHDGGILFLEDACHLIIRFLEDACHLIIRAATTNDWARVGRESTVRFRGKGTRITRSGRGTRGTISGQH